MKWLSKTFIAALAASIATEVDGAAGCLSSYCSAGTTTVYLNSCLLTDDDFDAIAACFTSAGLNTVEKVYLGDNSFTTIPADLFTGLTALDQLFVHTNPITSLDVATFQPVASTVSNLRIYRTELTTLPVGIFDGMVALESLYLNENLLTTLPAGVFDGLTSVTRLTLEDNELPTITPGLFDGMGALETLFLRENPLTTLPAGVFDGLTSVTRLYMDEVQLTTIPTGLFATMASLEELYMKDGMLAELEVGSFMGLTSMEQVDLRNNALTTLPDGVFDTLGDASSFLWLLLSGNEELQCVPSSLAAMSSYSSSPSDTTRGDEVPTAGLCECTGVATCDDGFTCSDGTEGYTCDAIVACAVDSDCDTSAGEACCLSKLICEVPDAADPGACGDPHMTGFRGQKFDFTGEDGKWYAVVSDLPYLHLNMRVTSPVPSLPEITYITGISIMTIDANGLNHAIVISVSDPHSMESACSVGMSSCLADGALHVVANGEEIMLTPDVVTLAPGVAIAAVNLPGECRSFGFEQYWEKKLQLAQPGRRLSGGDVLQDMSDWVLADPTATNMVECEDYVAAAVGGSGLFEHQSEHASFQIMTPTATIRLSHGRLHQLPMRDPTDQYDLPDHLAWQMNMAIDHNDMSLDATGILGETLVPTLDHTGAPIMQGMDAIRGAQEDYRVGGPLEVVFSQNQYHE